MRGQQCFINTHCLVSPGLHAGLESRLPVLDISARKRLQSRAAEQTVSELFILHRTMTPVKLVEILLLKSTLPLQSTDSMLHCELPRNMTSPSRLFFAPVLRETGNLLLLMSRSQIVVRILTWRLQGLSRSNIEIE